MERMDSQIKEIYHMVRKMSRERGTVSFSCLLVNLQHNYCTMSCICVSGLTQTQKTLQEDKYMVSVQIC